MKKSKNLKKVRATIKAVLAVAATGGLFSADNALADQEFEKCYAIAKQGMNDCKTSTHSCSGTATRDKQPDAFILVPKGICDKISGGSLVDGSEASGKK